MSPGYLGDLYALNLNSFAWNDLTSIWKGNAPTARVGACFIYYGERLFVFGGYDDSGKTPWFDLHLAAWFWHTWPDFQIRLSMTFITTRSPCCFGHVWRMMRLAHHHSTDGLLELLPCKTNSMFMAEAHLTKVDWPGFVINLCTVVAFKSIIWTLTLTCTAPLWDIFAFDLSTMKWQNLQAELYQGIPITLGGDLYNSMLVECNGLLFATGRLSEFDTSCKSFGGS